MTWKGRFAVGALIGAVLFVGAASQASARFDAKTAALALAMGLVIGGFVGVTGNPR